MEKGEILDLVMDTLETRFESYAQTQIKMHTEYHEKLLSAVETQIKTTVNGKIDKIQKTLDERLRPFEDTRNWFVSFKSGATWLAGFITPLAIIGGVLMWVIKEIKQ